MASDMTRVVAFKDRSAAEEYGKRFLPGGYRYVLVGPTDAVKLMNTADDGVPPLWESGTEADWTLVIISKAKIELATDPVT